MLVALACDEIIMAPDATIGSAGIDEKTIEDVMRSGYREIANRRRTVPVELALGMFDPTREVLEVETDVSREFVTPEGLDELRERQTDHRAEDGDRHGRAGPVHRRGGAAARLRQLPGRRSPRRGPGA